MASGPTPRFNMAAMNATAQHTTEMELRGQIPKEKSRGVPIRRSTALLSQPLRCERIITVRFRQDRGPEYRSIIGLPGGISSPDFPAFQVPSRATKAQMRFHPW